jgi:dTDP-4-dehydrorhamnose 3,5-epimerase-like enzyme
MASDNGTGAERGSVDAFRDERGALTPVDFAALPFPPARAYVLHDLPEGALRGGHAALRQQRFLVVVSGRVQITLYDGRASEAFELGPQDSLHVPPGHWHQLEVREPGVVVLVFADGPYDRDDYEPDRTALAASAAQTSDA